MHKWLAACSEGIFMIYTVMPDADFATSDSGQQVVPGRRTMGH